MNYHEAAAKLQGRCRERRRLERNTYLERRYTVAIAVRLHATDVLTLFPDGRIEINTGGWHTVTTRDRINRYLPSPWSVGSQRGTTVLYKSAAGYHWNPVQPSTTLSPSCRTPPSRAVATTRLSKRKSGKRTMNGTASGRVPAIGCAKRQVSALTVPGAVPACSAISAPQVAVGTAVLRPA
jgi:hypothetical protein